MLSLTLLQGLSNIWRAAAGLPLHELKYADQGSCLVGDARACMEVAGWASAPTLVQTNSCLWIPPAVVEGEDNSHIAIVASFMSNSCGGCLCK